MAPPQFARKTPGIDLIKPEIIYLFALHWNEFHGSIAHRVQCGANDFGGIDKPLIGQHGFNHDF